MFKRIDIMLCFLLFFTFDKASAQDNFQVFIPEFIPSSGSFEVSIITSNKFSQSDKLNLFLLPDFSLIINKIELWVGDDKLQIPVHNESKPDYSEQYQKVSIDLSDTSLFTDGTFFQLVLHLKSSSEASNTLIFFGEFIGEGKTLGYLMSSDSKIMSDKPNIYKLSFNYYEKSFIAENAATVGYNSYLNLPMVYNFDEELAAEFWIKFKNFHSTFLKIINWETNWIEYYLSLNENQMLVINSKDNELFQIKPFFVSKNIWYHFSLNFNKKNYELSFLCNGEELTRIKVKNYLAFDNLVLHFQNELLSGEFNLDQLRLVNIAGSPVSIQSNKNYRDYLDDSSNVAFQLNLSEAELHDLLTKKNISYERIRLVKSDAPIFPRAPEVSIKLSNNFYEVEWKGGSFKDADHYVLERAVGSSDFIETGKQSAINSEEKTYSLLSENYNQTEIVYFRIKQINKDGSEIYSDVVKVGQGIIEDLIIGKNYPNPFNPTTLIEFELLQDTDVEVKVFNLVGKEVTKVHSGFLARGIYKFKFDASGLPSGIYLYQVSTPLSSQTGKMILAK